MIKLSIEVTYDDGRTEAVDVRPATQVAFEREHKTSLGRLATEQLMSDLYWLAWHASRTASSFDEWLESVDGVAPVEDAAGVDPTPPAP